MATNPNEAIYDAETRHAIYLERFGKGVARRAVKLLLSAERDIIGKLRELPDGPTKAQQAALLRTVRARISDLVTDFRDQMTDELLDLADYEAEFTGDMFASAYDGLDVSFQSVPLENVRAAVTSKPFQGIHLRWANPPEHASELIRRNFRAMQGEIERGFIEGESIPTITARIRPLIEVRAARDVETIAITAVKHISSAARQEFHAMNPGVIEKERWNAVLDGRTCFPAGTMVKTPSGQADIATLSAGDTVIGGSGEPRKVNAALSSRQKKMARVTLSNGEVITCTADHLFLNDTQVWVQAEDLIVGEELSAILGG